MSTFSIIKDPQAVLDYTISYASIMAATSPNDTISTSTWAVDNGLKIGDLSSPETTDSNTTTTTTVWLNGGRLGAYCNAVNTITTAAGRTYERTIVVEIRNK